ncbi:uncharacterized protein LOC134273524 [Saccostrea cucullata]|uniref:uncharacterized protein LOC134273524 n=1 Tax=Saccostrea cuccullata TaxID=36930 RepID=UPI002ED17C62
MDFSYYFCVIVVMVGYHASVLTNIETEQEGSASDSEETEEYEPCGDSRFVYIDICYFFDMSGIGRTWYESRDVCNNMNASLVTITSRDQYHMLIRNVKMRDGYSEFWIGLNNIEQDGWK